MKKALLLGCAVLCLILSACVKGDDRAAATPTPDSVERQSSSPTGLVSDTSSPTDITAPEAAGVVEQFFAAFETSDYEAMKGFCTETCIAAYFHDGDVFGMVSARAVDIGKAFFTDDDRCRVFVTVEMEPSEGSALYPEKSTSFYVALERYGGGLWRIDSFYTG